MNFITFITDTKPGETEIISPSNMFKNLRVFDGDHRDLLFECEAPREGWSHDALCAVDLRSINDLCADAYLGDDWVGSTEV